MTDLRTEIQSAILDHIHEVRGVAALTDAIMGVVEKQSDEVHLWRFWNEKARELAASNARLRQQLAEERNKALEALKPMSDAVFNDNGDMSVSQPLPTYDECVKAYFVARQIRNALKAPPADAIRAMKDKP